MDEYGWMGYRSHGFVLGCDVHIWGYDMYPTYFRDCFPGPWSQEKEEIIHHNVNNNVLFDGD